MSEVAEAKTHYLENEEGGIHSVSQDLFDRLHERDGNAGRSYLPRGFKEISAAQAKAKHPQLFGAQDPQVTFTDDELVRAANRKKLMAELFPERDDTKPTE